MLSRMDHDDPNDFLSETPTGDVPSQTLAELSERTTVLACCDHEAIKNRQGSWELLQFVGIQPDFDDNGNDAPLALRNCNCGTTLARPVTAIDMVDESIRQQMYAVRSGAVTRDFRPSAIRAASQARLLEKAAR